MLSEIEFPSFQSDKTSFEIEFTRLHSDTNMYEIEFIGFQSDTDMSEIELTISKIIEEPSETKFQSFANLERVLP